MRNQKLSSSSQKTSAHKDQAPTPPTSKRRKKGELAAFIGEGVECKGKISNHGNVRVDGRFEGEIHTRGALLVGSRGVIEAKVRAGRVVSEGTIIGEIVAKERVQLLGKAILDGSLRTPQLLVDDGVTLKIPWSLWMKKSRVAGMQLDSHALKVIESTGVDQQALVTKR